MGKNKASGRNVKESERNTVAIKLRLEPGAAEDLKAYAEEFGVSMSDLVGRILSRFGGTHTDDLVNAIREDILVDQGKLDDHDREY